MNQFNDTQVAATCLLLSVADADEKLEENEIKIIQDILKDFFSIEQNIIESLLDEAKKRLNESTDIFQFGNYLNKQFNIDDKLDFICCIFEVAFADGDLHYLEHHTIKKIGNMLNLDRNDIISAKSEIESYL